MSAGLRSDMFAADGCVRPNIPTKPYRVTYAPKCEHVKIRAAQLVIQAQSEGAAEMFCRTYLKLPQMDVVTVEELTRAE